MNSTPPIAGLQRVEAHPDNSRRSMSWPAHVAVATVYAALIGSVFPAWLHPYVQPQRGGPEQTFRAGDLTPLFSVWTQVTARSLFEHGEWPLWTDHIYCGEPFFAKPQIGVISLTTLLTAALPAQVVATWTFLVHLWIAGISMYAWCLQMLRRTRADASDALGRASPLHYLPAACAGVSFLLSGLLIGHTIIGHGPIVLVACWTPVVLLFLDRALTSTQPVRFATLCGVIVAVQLLAGGETMFLYNVIAGGLLSISHITCGAPVTAEMAGAQLSRWQRMMRLSLRAAATTAVIGLFGFGLSAVKVLPGIELMPVSNRAGGLTLADASGIVLEFDEPSLLKLFDFGIAALSDLRHLFALTLLISIVGAFAGFRSERLRCYAVASLLLIAIGVAIAHGHAVFGLLWRAMPMFRYQRIPERALILTYVGVGPLVAIGVQSALRVWQQNSVRWCIATAVLGGIIGESWIAVPTLPPVAEIRQEVRENNILNYLAQQPGGYRIHAAESTDRNWGIEHVTVPLGLSNLTGWDHLWLRDYLGAEGTVGRDVRPFISASYSARHPGRFWGMMNVRYVTAMSEVHSPEFRLIGRFPIARSSQPAKSAGPFLYECVPYVPRAFIVPNALLVLGDSAERLEACYRLMDHEKFDPRRVAVVLCDLSELDKLTVSSGYQAVIMPARWSENDRNRVSDRGAGNAITYTMVVDRNGNNRLEWDRPGDLADLLSQLPERALPDRTAAADGGGAVSVEVSRGSFRQLKLPGRSGFLVLAEKFAHFPGWTARSNRGPCQLLRANAVGTAVRLDGTETTIEFRYRPAGFVAGLWVTLASLPLALAAIVFGDAWTARRLNRGA